MKYQELIPETNILALIVHEIICSGLNHNNNLIKIPNPGKVGIPNICWYTTPVAALQPDSDSAICRQI